MIMKHVPITLLVVAQLVLNTQSTLAQETTSPVFRAIVQAENALDARLGAAVYDLEGGKSWEYRANERFPMTSTFKALACAALLARGNTTLGEKVIIDSDDLVPYSPITERFVGMQVTGSFLCQATLRTSDNTAANKVLELIGGPQAVTEFVRSLGDRTTQLDRWEPDLNEGTPGDVRDTTTPKAIAATLQSLIVGNTLKDANREKLTSWLVSNEVGEPLLRSAFPDDWVIADRTGAGGYGSRGIIAVAWPPGRKPLVIAIYLTETEASIEDRNFAIAGIGSAIVAELDEDN
jgi:beta-lactamase class A/beta-lactamase class A CARB-5